MAFDKEEDPDRIQRIQINEYVEFIAQQESMIRKYDKLLNSVYHTMASYNPPDADFKPFYDKFVALVAYWKVIVAETKLYVADNYSEYSGLKEQE